MIVFHGKTYPRARVRKVSADVAGTTWAHARYWTTYLTAPGRTVEWSDGDPAVERHSDLPRAHVEATRAIAKLRGARRAEPAGAGDLR